MSDRTSLALGSLACCLLLGGICSGGMGQTLGPDAFGIPAYFGMSTPATTRQLGMGGAMACLNDVQVTNPAFAAAQDTRHAGMRVVTTDLERGPTVTSYLGHYVHPIRADESGLQLLLLSVDSSGGNAMFPGVGPVAADISEDALLVDYGRRFGEKLMAGLCILGSEDSQFSLTPPVGPALVSIDSEADYGARIGLAYEWEPGDYVGLTYAYSQNTVTTTGAMIGATLRNVYHCTQLSLGASRHFAPGIVGAIEYRRGSSQNGSSKSTVNSWHIGGEYRHESGAAFRLGLMDDNPTVGLGYDRDGWRIDYVYTRDWNEDAVGALFGGSDTHSLHLTYGW